MQRRLQSRHDTTLSFGANGEPFRQINKPCLFSCFVRPPAFADQTWRERCASRTRYHPCDKQTPAVEIECKIRKQRGDVRDAIFCKIVDLHSTRASLWRSRGARDNHARIRETMQQNKLKWASIAQPYQFARIVKAEPDFVTLSRPTHCGIASQRLVRQETFDAVRQQACRLRLRVDAPSSMFSKDRKPTQA